MKKQKNDNAEQNKTKTPYAVLVVEDDEGLSRLIRKRLQRAGFHAEGVFNGSEVIARVADNPATLLLLDYKLPHMTGKQIIETLEKRKCPVPFIIMTGHGDEKIAVEMMKLGARDYMVKDSAFLDLLPRVVKQVIDQLAVEKKLAEAEQALRQSEERYRSLVDNIDFGVTLMDSDHNIVMTNAAQGRLLNKPVSEFLGKKCFQEFEKLEVICPHCPGVQAMATGLPAEVETEGAKDAGTRFSARIQAFPTFGQNGTVTGFIEIVEDITEKKHLEAKLQQAQKMEAIGTLAGGIAHDFNNLLMGIQGNVSLMLLNIDSMHPCSERLKKIENQVESGAKLTTHLLGYARKGKYKVKPFDLNQLVEGTSEAFSRTRKQVTIHRELADDLFAIEADSGQIEQVLWNLLVNAADAMPRGGDLILKTTNVTHQDIKGKLHDPKPVNYVLLTVTDTGMGMDKETMERIFDPFYTTKEMGRGTGLGLASAFGIITSHGGYIDVESKKGHGATFSVYVPASEKPLEKAIKTAVEVMKASGTVFLVDDEEVILEVGKELLEGMGYRVLTANNGEGAVEVYRKNRDDIDIVVLDMVMPNMGGGEAYDRMKEINPDIKVLLSSGYSIDGEATEILKRGCNGFIQKPFKMKELCGTIGGILEKK